MPAVSAKAVLVVPDVAVILVAKPDPLAAGAAIGAAAMRLSRGPWV